MNQSASCHSPKKTVAVFCGSSNAGSASEQYATAAKKLAMAIAKHDLDLVYGGGGAGLMGIVAATALSLEKVSVTGIIPSFMRSFIGNNPSQDFIQLVNTALTL